MSKIEYGHPFPQHPTRTQPVNFNDDATTSQLHSPPLTSDTRSVFTHYTSGIPVDDPAPISFNERGESRAQELANSYRSARSAGPAPPLPSTRSPAPSGAHRRANSTATSRMDALTYIDEDFNYYSSRKPTDESTNDASHASLVRNAQDLAGMPPFPRTFQDMDYSEAGIPPTPRKKGFTLFGGDAGRYPIEQRIENKRRGIGRQQYPFVVWTLGLAMLGVFLFELARNWQEQGTPVSFHPTVNPMLGPSQDALINFGARFPPCMKTVPDVPITLELGCLNNTDNPPTRLCSLETICGFGGFHGKPPNQWWRFITPIFLHAGIVHIALNLFAMLSLSAQIEKDMGSSGFLILYFAAGIFGNVLGGNFALVGAPSLGASGAIFGTIAVLWVDLFAHWHFEYKPWRKLIFLIIDLIIGFGLGYVPGVDNFAHLGGFFMGLLCGTILLPVISTTKRHRSIMWALRIAAIPVAVILYVVLVRNFYTGNPYAACSGCRFLSCFPTAANNRCQGTGITITNSPN